MKVSIVIPAYNEAELLPRALAALIPQARLLGAEVIVVNNNSTDTTADIAQQVGARVVHEPRQGYVYAMNRGLQEAVGDIVAFTDADSVVAPDWLATVMAGFSDPEVVGITGPIHFERLRMIGWSRVFFSTCLVGSNMAVRRLVALEAGGFDITYNLASDIAFSWQMKRYGRVKFIRRLRVLTSARRFQAAPVREGLRYGLNFAWMVIFRRPLIWHFTPVRRSAEELERQTRRRNRLSFTLAVVLALVYLSAWPTSSVFGQITTHVHTKQKLVALTFDDGPNGLATRAIVDILKSKNVPATFFEVGRSIAADPTTSRYVSQAGFPIENHSWDHSFRLPYMTPGHIHHELAATSAEINVATGQSPTMFRPPHGLRSPELLYEAEHLHLRMINWTVDPQDYNTGDPSLITDRIVDHVRHGSIILLHDGLQDGPHAEQLHDRRGTIEALPEIIDRLRADGYTFVNLKQILGPEKDDKYATSV